MRVLLVDDEQEFVATLAERLNIRGFDASFATCADEALKILEQEGAFDIGVLDMKMPGIGGLRLREIIEQKYPKMKIIFLTGHGSESDYRAGSLRAAGYLIKPVDISILIEKMTEIMNA